MDDNEELLAYTAAQGALLALVRLSHATASNPSMYVHVNYQHGLYRVQAMTTVERMYCVMDEDICTALHKVLDIVALEGVKDVRD